MHNDGQRAGGAPLRGGRRSLALCVNRRRSWETTPPLLTPFGAAAYAGVLTESVSLFAALRKPPLFSV